MNIKRIFCIMAVLAVSVALASATGFAGAGEESLSYSELPFARKPITQIEVRVLEMSGDSLEPRSIILSQEDTEYVLNILHGAKYAADRDPKIGGGWTYYYIFHLPDEDERIEYLPHKNLVFTSEKEEKVSYPEYTPDRASAFALYEKLRKICNLSFSELQDVSDRHWASAEIRWAVDEHALVRAYAERPYFWPTARVSVLDALTMLEELDADVFFEPEFSAANIKDLLEVESAYDQGLTRAQAIELLYAYYLWKESGEAMGSAEAQRIDDSTAASWAESRGLIRGYPDGTLRLEDNITRAQFVTMLYRLFS